MEQYLDGTFSVYGRDHTLEPLRFLEETAQRQENKSPSFWEQYAASREKYPDAVLLVRVGDFYEAFEKDAERLRDAFGYLYRWG